jgi:hypothetical protein
MTHVSMETECIPVQAATSESTDEAKGPRPTYTRTTLDNRSTCVEHITMHGLGYARNWF